MGKPKLKKLSAELKQALKAALKDKFRQLILFGSYARGDYRPESDIDFMLLLKEPLTKAERETLSEISSDLSLKYDAVLVCFKFLESEFQQWETQMFKNVRREGIRV